MSHRTRTCKRAPRPHADEPSRAGFTLVEVVVALTILAGVLLGLSDFTHRYAVATRDAATVTVASDVAAAQLESVKGWREYGTLVSTHHGGDTTFTAGAWDGLRRQTFVTRTGPTPVDDYVTVTVVVSGRGLDAPIRKTTIIAAF